MLFCVANTNFDNLVFMTDSKSTNNLLLLDHMRPYG